MGFEKWDIAIQQGNRTTFVPPSKLWTIHWYGSYGSIHKKNEPWPVCERFESEKDLPERLPKYVKDFCLHLLSNGYHDIRKVNVSFEGAVKAYRNDQVVFCEFDGSVEVYEPGKGQSVRWEEILYGKWFVEEQKTKKDIRTVAGAWIGHEELRKELEEED